VQLIGSRRLSTALGDLVEALNAKRPDPFRFHDSFDANGHRENLYCRSDHAMYARYGIPVVFFTTGLHRDYHQVTDEPQYIAYHKLERLTGFVRDVVVTVANKPSRPKVDRPRPDPAAACRQ
jgi:Peptidase family M28